MVDISRRNFIRAKRATTPPPIRLPWTADEALFTRGCTQCGDCVNACEENIIVKGDGGFPEIDFSAGECTFCQRCVNVCKEPLFKPFNEQAWQLNIEIENSCLAKKQVHCQVCQDNCEVAAINFTYIQGSVPQPEISLADCNGCGACVASCPEAAIQLSTSILGANHE